MNAFTGHFLTLHENCPALPARGMPGKRGQSLARAKIFQRLIVAFSASMDDWMPASVDMVKSSISRLTQSL